MLEAIYDANTSAVEIATLQDLYAATINRKINLMPSYIRKDYEKYGMYTIISGILGFGLIRT